MTVRTGIIDGPVRSALPPVGMIRARILAGIKTVLGGVHQPRERPLAGNLPVRRPWEVFVLVARIFAEGALRESRADQNERGQEAGRRKTQADEVEHRYS